MQRDFTSTAETLIPLVKKAQEVNVHVSAVTRWRDHGICDRAGNRIRLRCCRVGGRWFVRPDDWDRFISALNSDPSEMPASPIAPSHTAEAAARELERLGI
ncbi:hypothetical protein [Singulisphaera sp. PoT]|uniref:hypothetical protein n=1 Tax=Singulisphaera sp. PoT TaxID=3411797 RepID=UPI003BF46EE8